MRLTGTLRFRLTILFIISLTILSVAILTFLLHGIEQRILSEFDDVLYERIENINEYVDNELYEFDDDDFEPENDEDNPEVDNEEEGTEEDEEEFLKERLKELEAELLELVRNNKEEIFILSHEEDDHIFTKSFDEKHSVLRKTDFEPFEFESIKTVQIEGFPNGFRFLASDAVDDHVLAMVVPLDGYYSQVNKIRWYFVSAAISFILLGGGLAWMTVAGSMRGVELVSDAADDFGQGDLKRRVNWSGKGSEIEHLASSFNAMAAQTESLIYEMKDVTNNIAHDLRTPVTRMRGIAENSLQNDENPDLAAKVIEECERQASIIEDILNLSESESGVLQLNLREENLNEILLDMIELYEPLAEDSNCVLELKLPDDQVIVRLDRSRFQRAAANILDNALKYSGGGRILIELLKADTVQIRIQDSGPGVPTDLKSSVFKRFVRGDASRGSGGCGLGLSLARSYIQNHNGDIILEEGQNGASFLMILPA